MPNELPRPPKADGNDVLHRVEKAAVSLVPGVNAAAELFGLLQSPLERRQAEWFESLWTAIKQLEERVDGFSVDALHSNEQFTTGVLHATQIAQRTHQQEKRDALRNAVLSIAVGRAPDEDLQLIFLHLIDVFTPWHVRMITFFQDPRRVGELMGIKYPNWATCGFSQVLEHTFADLRGRRDFYDQIVKELYDSGLAATGNIHVLATATGVFGKHTTPMGDQFIRFITSPVEAT